MRTSAADSQLNTSDHRPGTAGGSCSCVEVRSALVESKKSMLLLGMLLFSIPEAPKKPWLFCIDGIEPATAKLFSDGGGAKML
jgi:hypothetical protein